MIFDEVRIAMDPKIKNIVWKEEDFRDFVQVSGTLPLIASTRVERKKIDESWAIDPVAEAKQGIATLFWAILYGEVHSELVRLLDDARLRGAPEVTIMTIESLIRTLEGYQWKK